MNEKTEYEFLCSTSDYLQNGDYYRVHKIGESVHQPTSMRNAIELAQHELARNIALTLNGAIENYFHNNRILYDELFREDIIKTTVFVAEESVLKVDIICEETIKTLNGLYRTYIVMEISANEVMNELEKKTSENSKYQNNVNRSEFKNYLEQEMNQSIKKSANK